MSPTVCKTAIICEGANSFSTHHGALAEQRTAAGCQPEDRGSNARRLRQFQLDILAARNMMPPMRKCILCNDREAERNRRKCWKCREYLPDPQKYLARKRQYAVRLKREVIDHYGGKCACCNESNIHFLTIDHVNGNGGAHRKQIGGGGKTMHLCLKRSNYPKDYQVLCFNCNCGRQINQGICPHKLSPSASA